MKRNTRLAIALLLIAAGSLIWYLCGYRQSLAYDISALLLIAGGWLMLGMLCFGSIWKADASRYQPDRRNWLRGRRMLLLVAIALLIGGNAWWADTASDRLAASWLQGPLVAVTATVLNVKMEAKRQQYFYETIIRYRAGTREMEETFKSSRHYNPGDNLQISYSAEHPEVFRVEGRR